MKERIHELELKCNNIINLEDEINILRKKNKELLEKINQLEISSNIEINKTKEFNEEIKQLNHKITIKDKMISESFEQIMEKDKIIKEYESKKSQFPFDFATGEKILTIIFMSIDESIIFPIVCKNTDIFCIIENKFYQKYSEYKDLDTYFFSNGKKINKNKSLDENNIKNNDIITIFN